MADIEQIVIIYTKGGTYREMGKATGVSRQRAEQIIKRELSRRPYLQQLRQDALLVKNNERNEYRKNVVCLNCGDKFDPLYSKNRKFCSSRCVGLFFKNCLVKKTITK